MRVLMAILVLAGLGWVAAGEFQTRDGGVKAPGRGATFLDDGIRHPPPSQP